jgi:hypothetical protein
MMSACIDSFCVGDARARPGVLLQSVLQRAHLVLTAQRALKAQQGKGRTKKGPKEAFDSFKLLDPDAPPATFASGAMRANAAMAAAKRPLKRPPAPGELWTPARTHMMITMHIYM